MIAYIKGELSSVGLRSVVLMTGGLGYEIFLTLKNIQGLQAGQVTEFFIYSHIKDDAFDLYGFKTAEELDLFKKLLSVSGVGPKSAVNILGLADVTELKRAISQGDPSFLQQVSGVGRKTAERIVVELKEKFIEDVSSLANHNSATDRQVVEALLSLGYKEREALEAIKSNPSQATDLATRLKDILKIVAK